MLLKIHYCGGNYLRKVGNKTVENKTVEGII